MWMEGVEGCAHRHEKPAHGYQAELDAAARLAHQPGPDTGLDR
jgi:hypothetical protein